MTVRHIKIKLSHDYTWIQEVKKKKAQQLVKRGQKVLTDSFLPVELPELSHSQHIRLTFSNRHSGTAMLFYSFTASPHLSFSVFSNLNTFFHVFVHPFFFLFPFYLSHLPLHGRMPLESGRKMKRIASAKS